ncbi:MAG TPA: hypothetical protein VNT99_14150 [Methylomirabilota bacterium]|nr:hypothetical protein [Methylomirabilota bacterium]
MLIALILPSLRSHGHNPASCVSNLKQTSLAALLWVQDRDQPFPWQVPLTRTGTLELISSPQVFRHFSVMSNELYSPKILICPLDKKRRAGADFMAFSNRNISYFVNLAAQFDTNGVPAPMFGDRNLTGGSLSNGFLRTLSSTNGLGWSKELHQHFGNIALADGSVSRVETQALHALVRTSAVPLRLAIPAE